MNLSISLRDRSRATAKFYWLSKGKKETCPATAGNVSRPPFSSLSRRGESMIAFMGEERVLCGGDNVFVAATEASLSEIKHDEPRVPRSEAREKRGGGREGNFTLPSRFSSPSPINFASFLATSRIAQDTRSYLLAWDISLAIITWAY